MLELRPICENCATELPPAATNAMICSYECTFCRECVENVLADVCPNCGGGFAARPIRPVQAWRTGVTVANLPPVPTRTHHPVDPKTHADFAEAIRSVPPEQR